LPFLVLQVCNHDLQALVHILPHRLKAPIRGLEALVHILPQSAHFFAKR